MRDRDVRNDIRNRLLATNAFDDVWLTGLPDLAYTASSSQCAAAIEPNSSEFTPTWDSALLGGILVTSKVAITLLVRHPDAELRDELAEQLMNVAANVLNGQSLAGFVSPQMTRFLSCVWNKAVPPERRIATIFSYQYILEGWDSADQST